MNTSGWEISSVRCDSCDHPQYIRCHRTVDRRSTEEIVTRFELRCRNSDCETGQSFSLLEPRRCEAQVLYSPWYPSLPILLRVDGDSDDPETWHLITTIRYEPCSMDRPPYRTGIDEMAFIFLDGTPMVVVNKTDLVEFAIPRHVGS